MIDIQEFQNYLKSFEKQKGEFTFEDQLAIGVKFKQLPRKQRDWNKLANALGLTCTGNAYRKRIETHLKRNPGLLDDVTEGEVYANDYIEQQKVRDWYNAYRRDLREEGRIENLKDEIRQAAEKFSAMEPSYFKAESYNVDNNEGLVEAVLLLSDLHIGVECANYYNTYNTKVALERLTTLANNTIKYCKRNNVSTLHVLNLGDMIQGLIHTNARIEAQLDVAEQIIVAGEIVASFLNKIKEAAPHITYRSVFDNHSRAMADKNQHIEKE